MSQSVFRTNVAVPPRIARALDRPRAIPPASGRTLPVASGRVDGVNDEDVPILKVEARTRSCPN